MMSTINFNYKSLFEAHEINDESSERLLATKLIPGQLARTQFAP